MAALLRADWEEAMRQTAREQFNRRGRSFRRTRGCGNMRKNWLAGSIPKMVTIRNGEFVIFSGFHSCEKKFILYCAVGLAVPVSFRPLTAIATPNRGHLRTNVSLTNLEADVSGLTPPLPGLIAPPGNSNSFTSGGVLEGIGEEIVGNDASTAAGHPRAGGDNEQHATVTPIVNGLNTFYGVAGMYSNSSYQATEEAAALPAAATGRTQLFSTRRPSNCSRPCRWTRRAGQIIWVASVRRRRIREVMRYEFAPAGVATNVGQSLFTFM